MDKNAGSLGALRKQIDAVDSVILRALAKRVKLVRSIGIYKRKRGIKPLDQKRRDERKKAWKKAGKELHLPASFVSDLFRRIHKLSISVERAVE